MKTIALLACANVALLGRAGRVRSFSFVPSRFSRSGLRSRSLGNLAFAVLLVLNALRAQPASVGSAPVPGVIEDAAQRRAEYISRARETLTWFAARARPG